MNTSVKHYREILTQVKGTHIQKIKTLLEQEMQEWYLEDESLIIDLLDDSSLTAEDLLETLQGLAEIDEENRAFHHAVLAIDLMLKEGHRIRIPKQTLEVAWEDKETDFEVSDTVLLHRMNDGLPLNV